MKNQQLDGPRQVEGDRPRSARPMMIVVVGARRRRLRRLPARPTHEVDWAVLYANVDDTTASDVLAGLDAHGIPYQVDGNGTRILVPRRQLATTRVTLAGEGITAQPVPQGFDEIFANQGLASSDFEQRVNYERALEGELARTLLAMEPVAGAHVQLSIPEQSHLHRRRPTPDAEAHRIGDALAEAPLTSPGDPTRSPTWSPRRSRASRPIR